MMTYIPSPLWGEGRVRGGGEMRVVCESPRDFARGLRRRQTDAERRLWARLRDRRLLGVKFARQVPIGPYVVDFCCREQKLIVELDGGQHAAQADYDAGRTAFLRRWAIACCDSGTTTRSRIPTVCFSALPKRFALRAPHPGPLPRGERGTGGTLAPEGGEGRVRGS